MTASKVYSDILGNYIHIHLSILSRHFRVQVYTNGHKLSHEGIFFLYSDQDYVKQAAIEPSEDF